MEILTGILYILIGILFAYNFNVILQRIKKGSNKVNKYSLLATSSLTFIFWSEAVNHFGLSANLVLLAQLYLLWTVLYIAYSKKRAGEKE